MRSPERGMLVITHYQRLLDYIRPDRVHVLAAGRIVASGGPELAHELEREGYDKYCEGCGMSLARAIETGDRRRAAIAARRGLAVDRPARPHPRDSAALAAGGRRGARAGAVRRPRGRSDRFVNGRAWPRPTV